MIYKMTEKLYKELLSRMRTKDNVIAYINEQFQLYHTIHDIVTY